MANELLLALVATVVFLILALFIVSFALLFKRRQQQNIREKALMKAEFERELLKTQVEIQEQTMRHISQELHDDIGQILSLVKINLANLPLDPESGAIPKVTTTRQLVGKAIESLRNLSKTLDSDYLLNSELSDTLRFELSLIEQSGACQTQLHVNGPEWSLTTQQKLIVFRIVQEVLNNALKHARATLLVVTLRYHQDFCVQIEDNGLGFDWESLKTTGAYEKGAGLNNIHNRAALIGASVRYETAPGHGTTVTLTLPGEEEYFGK